MAPAPALSPFWPNTKLGPFWPISQLDSLWDLAIHSESATHPPELGSESVGPGEGVGEVAGGAAVGADVTRFCQPLGLGSTKFQCTLCRKLFRSPEFVYKHVLEKHIGAGAGDQTSATPATASPPETTRKPPAEPPVVAETPAVAAAVEPPSCGLTERLLAQTDFLIEEVGDDPQVLKEVDAATHEPAEPQVAATPAVLEPQAQAPAAAAEPQAATPVAQVPRFCVTPAAAELQVAATPAVPEPQAPAPAAAAEPQAATPVVEAPAPAAGDVQSTDDAKAAAAAAPRTIEDLCVALGTARFQCGICQKQFRGPDFVQKHLRQKHAAEVEALGSARAAPEPSVAAMTPEAPTLPAEAKATNAGDAAAAAAPRTDEASAFPAGSDDLGAEGASAVLPELEVPLPEDEQEGREARNAREGSVLFGDVDGPDREGSSQPEPPPVAAQVDLDEAPPPATAPGKLARGCKVEITGLTGRPELNGLRGVIMLKEAVSGRFEVKLDGAVGERVRCKPDNLVQLVVRQSAKKSWGDAAFKEGKIEQAVGFYTSALREDVEGDAELEGTIHSNLALAYSRKKDHAQALEEAKKAASLRPSWATGHVRMGSSLLSLGRETEARSSFMKALQLDPLAKGCLEGLAATTEKLAKDSGRASRWAEAEGKKAKGNAAVKAGDLPTALACYTVSIALLQSCADSSELQQGLAVYFSNRAAVFAKLRQWDASLADATEARRCSPNWFKAQLRVACALLGQGHAELSFRAYLDASELPGGQFEAMKDCQHALWQIPTLESPLARTRLRRFEEGSHRRCGSCRIFAIAGVHIDQAVSVVPWAEGISETEFRDDVLIVSSLGDTFNAVKRGLAIFKKKFRRVFYIPGNHDLWIRPNTDDSQRRKFRNSVEKLLALLDLCDGLGVDMLPAEVMEDVFVAPLLSWWTCRFSDSDPRPSGERHDSFCKWPMGEEGAHKYFLRWNEQSVCRIQKLQQERGRKCEVISCSHFLPTNDIPTWEMPVKASGCQLLEDQIRKLGSRLHLFGHTRRNETHQIRGVTYQQHTLMSPEYDHGFKRTFLKVHDGRLLVPGQPHGVY